MTSYFLRFCHNHPYFAALLRIIAVGAFLLISVLVYALPTIGAATTFANQIYQEGFTSSNNSFKDNVVKLNVVYIPQNDTKSCATTSIAMVISYYENLNKPLDKETVRKISGSDENMVHNYGSDMQGLKRIADYYGFHSNYIEHMKIEDIEHFLSKRMPAMINIHHGKYYHSLLVVGYDKNKKIFYVNDPENRQNKILEYSDLKTRWYAQLSSPKGLSNQSGFIVYPKNYELGLRIT